MEKETLLVVLNSQKIENDLTASGNPEDHDDSYKIDTVSEQENENEQVEENEDEDNKGVVSVSIQSKSNVYRYRYVFVSRRDAVSQQRT